MNNTSFRTLMEKVKAENEPNVKYIELPVPASKIVVSSVETLDMHHGVLYKNYVKKALAGEGDFQIAGAKLHTLFFEQFQECDPSNKPLGEVKDLINKKYGSYSKFKDTVREEALTIHGSGWVYMDTSGNIKTIANHKVVDNIALIIDMWEHSYVIDYQADKEKYLKDIWQIINFNIINERLT
jgi:Fe-Mn family superoxide dismutase